MELSDNEKILVKWVRELKPFEIIEIHKDKMGDMDSFLVKRSQKIMLTKQETKIVNSEIA
mgnify:CR=1 FL=1